MVNWDASVDKKNRRMGIGVIVCDCKGEVLATLSAPKEGIIDLVIAQATVQELGLFNVILEGDSLQVVQVLDSAEINWSKYGHLIEEARSLLF